MSESGNDARGRSPQVTSARVQDGRCELCTPVREIKEAGARDKHDVEMSAASKGLVRQWRGGGQKREERDRLLLTPSILCAPRGLEKE